MGSKKMEGQERLYLGSSYPNVYFTRREIDCMIHLLKDKTVSEVASEIGLSRRTVEFYVNNMKSKLMTKRKKELINKVRKSDFLTEIAKNTDSWGGYQNEM